MNAEVHKGKAPKGWHIAKGKELKAIEARMERDGLMSKRRATCPPDPRLWYQIVVKNKP